MRILFVAGNWKMNSTTESTEFPEEHYINAIAESSIDKMEVCIFPPATHIGLLSAIADGFVQIGGQDVSADENGAHTGDISADCLLDVGATYVLVGHSERRQDHNETDFIVSCKTSTALKSGLKVVICIGESETDKQAGKTMDVLKSQLDGSIPDNARADRIVIAYEPIWAIGTGRVPTLDDIESVHKELRSYLATSHYLGFADSVRIIYGGSVKPSNAKDILGLANVDGALIGGASLKSEDFIGVMNSIK